MLHHLLCSGRRTWPQWLPYVFVAWCAWLTHGQIQHWASDVTLWAHAVEHAPFKPRPAMNYGVALLEADQRAEAGEWFQRAAYLARLPHIPSWDRQQAQRRGAFK